MTIERDHDRQGLPVPTPGYDDTLVEVPVETAPGWYDAPEVESVSLEHDVRLPAIGTVVRVLVSGWGWLKLESDTGEALFRLRRFAWVPGRRSLDAIVPLHSTLVIRFANIFGSDQKILTIEPTTSLAPAPPRFAGTIGTSMPPLILSLVDGSTVKRIKGPEAQIRVSLLRPVPRPLLNRAVAWQPTREHSRLTDALKSLKTQLGHKQHYRREKFRPEYRAIVGPEVDMSPAQRRLREWMAEIHHGADES